MKPRRRLDGCPDPGLGADEGASRGHVSESFTPQSFGADPSFLRLAAAPPLFLSRELSPSRRLACRLASGQCSVSQSATHSSKRDVAKAGNQDGRPFFTSLTCGSNLAPLSLPFLRRQAAGSLSSTFDSATGVFPCLPHSRTVHAHMLALQPTLTHTQSTLEIQHFSRPLIFLFPSFHF